MRSTHTLVTLILASILTILFGVGYFNMVSPNDKQHKAYDKDREADFKSIVNANQDYYKKNHKLAESLKKLSEETNHTASDGNDFLQTFLDTFGGFTYRDPQTNQIYGYKFDDITGKKFQLCAKFATEKKDSDTSGSKEELSESTSLFNELFKESSKNGVLGDVKHGKGYQCVDFSIDDGQAKAEVDYQRQKSTTYDSSSAEVKSRDIRRKEDLNAISSGLEQYYNDNSEYPTALTKLTGPSVQYLKTIPTDPKTGSSYEYIPLPSGGPIYTSFKLQTKLENDKDIDINVKPNIYEVVNKQ